MTTDRNPRRLTMRSCSFCLLQTRFLLFIHFIPFGSRSAILPQLSFFILLSPLVWSVCSHIFLHPLWSYIFLVFHLRSVRSLERLKNVVESRTSPFLPFRTSFRMRYDDKSYTFNPHTSHFAYNNTNVSAPFLLAKLLFTYLVFVSREILLGFLWFWLFARCSWSSRRGFPSLKFRN